MKEPKVKAIFVTVISSNLWSSINLLLFCGDVPLQYQVLDCQTSCILLRSESDYRLRG